MRWRYAKLKSTNKAYYGYKKSCGRVNIAFDRQIHFLLQGNPVTISEQDSSLITVTFLQFRIYSS